MATIRNVTPNWEFHQQMHRRARELARIADPLAGLRAVLGPSYLTPAWAPYTNPLLREMERTRQWMEALKPLLPQLSADWGDLIQKATAQFDPGKIDLPEPDTEAEAEADTRITLRIDDLDELDKLTPEKLGQVLAQVTAAVFCTLTGLLEHPEDTDEREWTLRAYSQAFTAGEIAAALWEELTDDTEG
ncbi:hypothetical protein [Streptomyces swartbergensis]|uniref:Uncharacterized protein n=1 Tax=Streptomyces swartbergensis TaxID=487165 RepID=A0A243QGG1_9ACTN|nr:hypothetical protein [Streptomyces swartbergensis]OUC81196.1 hypothetical protein CA983_43075 [Streptomyces swartbergensis]